MKELRDRVVSQVRKVVVGQDHVVEALLAATTVNGHVLLEGVPGVAKTLLAHAFARSAGVEFRRVQFTPDMLPSDLTGTMALRGNAALQWSPAGYVALRPRPTGSITVLTPPATLAALAHGYRPHWHPSAEALVTPASAGG